MAFSEEPEKYRAPALDKGLDILELLAGTEEGLSQAEIANALQRTPNEIYRMLDRLVRRDYVRRTSSDRYELTLKLFELAHGTPPMRRLVSHSMPVIRRLARQSGQAAHLVVHDRSALVVVAQADSPNYWNVSIRVGSRIGFVNTGSGHVFLAFASEVERALLLGEQEQLPAALLPRLQQVREQGYEIMDSQQVASVTNISVPIFGPLGGVLAVLTCPYTQRLERLNAPERDEVLELVIAACKEISRSVSGQPAVSATPDHPARESIKVDSNVPGRGH